MSSKAYSKQEREEIRIQLLEVALDIYSCQGIKNTRLVDILKVVGISKPFFYKFYPSVENFIVSAITYQWNYVARLIDDVEKHIDWTWQEKLYHLFNQFIDYKNNKILVMTQEEEVWVRKKLDDSTYNEFMQVQIDFFEKLMSIGGVSKDKCDPKVLGNLILSGIIVYNSGKEALPFLYTDQLRETADTQMKAIIAYLTTLEE